MAGTLGPLASLWERQDGGTIVSSLQLAGLRVQGKD